MHKIIFMIEKIKNTESAQLWELTKRPEVGKKCLPMLPVLIADKKNC